MRVGGGVDMQVAVLFLAVFVWLISSIVIISLQVMAAEWVNALNHTWPAKMQVRILLIFPFILLGLTKSKKSLFDP